MPESPVIVVGGGLAGLACALHLQEHGVRPLVLEASDGLGGRARTDEVEGFRLDRGFQVLLTAYPEARSLLDYDALDLRPFVPGARIRTRGRFVRLLDPYRRPLSALGALVAPVGTLRDRLRIGRLRRAVRRGSLEELWHRPETTTLAYLRAFGFGEAMIDTFFRPFFGGVFLDSRLTTSSRMLEFVYRMFAEGEAAVPARGMGAIAAQLASRLPAESVRTHAPVATIEADHVVLESGERLDADAVVVATDPTTAARFVPELDDRPWKSVTCLYFAADRAPVNEPLLVLDGEGTGPVNNFHVASAVSPDTAPAGQALLSATVLDEGGLDAPALEGAVRAQLRTWFGAPVDAWRLLRTYRIPHALPDQTAPALADPERSVRVRAGLYVCGDHRENASIQGAFGSARRAAEAIVADLATRAES